MIRFIDLTFEGRAQCAFLDEDRGRFLECPDGYGSRWSTGHVFRDSIDVSWLGPELGPQCEELVPERFWNSVVREPATQLECMKCRNRVPIEQAPALNCSCGGKAWRAV